jgi:hypothetical protein
MLLQVQNNGTPVSPDREYLNLVGATVTDASGASKFDFTTVPAGTAVTAAAGATSFDYSAATGIFKTSKGLNTFPADVSIAPAAVATGVPTTLLVTGAADTTQTASTEKVDVNINLARTVQFSTGAITTQRAMVIQAPTYAFVGASTISDAATLAITGAPAAGTNATITDSYALWVQSGTLNFGDGTVTQLTNATTAVTCNTASGVITTVSETAAAGASATFTVNCSACTAHSVVKLQLGTYSGTLVTNGIPFLSVPTVSAGSFQIMVTNIHGTNALNGTLKIHYLVT